MKKNTLSKLLCAVLALTMAFGMAACEGSGSAPAQEAPAAAAEPEAVVDTGVYKDSLIIGVSQSWSTLDAQAGTVAGDKIITKMIHMPLVFLNSETGELGAGVAESWEQTDDVTYVFHLRENAKFHNGEPVKASDVIYTYTRGQAQPGSKSVLAEIAEMREIDEHTVELKLGAVDVDYPTKISDVLYSIMSEKAITEDEVNGPSIGCGPYVADENVLSDHVTMHKFEEYWDAENLKTNSFTFRLIPEASARLIALQNGEINYCMNPSTAEIKYIESDPSLQLTTLASSRVMHIAINTQSELGSNLKLRQAIASGFSKEDVITVAADGAGVPAKTHWSTSLLGFYDGFEGFSYNPDAAKQLLAEAGYPDGVTLEIVCDKSNTSAVQTIMAELDAVGIHLTLNEMDSAGLKSYMSEGKHTLVYQNKSYGATVEGPRKVFVTGLSANDARYSNARVDELFAQGGTTFDLETRLACYKEVQEILGEEVPYIPVYYPTIFMGSQKGFSGVMTQTGGMFWFAYAYMNA